MYHDILQQKIDNLNRVYDIIMKQVYYNEDHTIKFKPTLMLFYNEISNNLSLQNLDEYGEYNWLKQVVDLVLKDKRNIIASHILGVLRKESLLPVSVSLIESIEFFKSFCIEPLYIKIISALSSQQLALSTLYRYKHNIEVFEAVKKDLTQKIDSYEKSTEVKRTEEVVLQPHLFQFLHEQGLVYFNEIHTVDGRVDLLSSHSGQKFIGEVKLFKGRPSKTELAINQISTYLSNLDSHNISIGYLIIYNLTDGLLTTNSTQLNSHGKTIYIVIIDLRKRIDKKSASTKSTEKTYCLDFQKYSNTSC